MRKEYDGDKSRDLLIRNSEEFIYKLNLII